jgi:glutathione S-transferase
MTIEIIGRSSSHFTRVARIFAFELDVEVELVPIYDLAALDEASYAGNPALKLPTLRRNGSLLFGTQNICRALAELASPSRRIVWPEDLHDDCSRNAQELVWHAMAAQVQLVTGTLVAALPVDNVYFVKGRRGFEGALRWLDDNLPSALGVLPARDLSMLEVTLFCLVDHLRFRETLPLAPYPALLRFSELFAQRPSAVATPYAFDTPPER